MSAAGRASGRTMFQVTVTVTGRWAGLTSSLPTDTETNRGPMPNSGSARDAMNACAWRSCGHRPRTSSATAMAGSRRLLIDLTGGGGVAERPAAHPEEGCAPVRSRGPRALNVEHPPPGHGERVRDQRAVAPPREGLRAHDGGGAPPRDPLEAGLARRELLGLHVVGVAAKRGVAPAEIDRVCPSVAQPAQRLQVPVAELAGVKRARQRGAIELRVVPRPGDRANVHHLLHPVGAEQLEELPGGAGGVADRVESLHQEPRAPSG